MYNRMNVEIAQEHIADLQRAASERHAVKVAGRSRRNPIIALRAAGPDDAPYLGRLAALDSARPLTGDTLVAVVDGNLVAAISLESGRVIADPLAPTAEARALLHTRAAQLAETPRRPWRRFRPRFA